VQIDEKDTTRTEKVLIPWLQTLGFESAVTEHIGSQAVLDTLVSLVEDAGGYVGLSLAQTKLLNDAYETNLATNEKLPPSIKTTHQHPFHPLNLMTVHARDFREEEFYQP